MLLLGLLAGLVLSGARVQAAPTPVEGEERARILRQLQERQQSVTSLRATVVQRKRSPLLKDEVVREGELLFSRPARLRWEVRGPDPSIVVLDGQQLTVYRPERREAERRDLSADLAGRAAVEFLTAGMSLAVADLEKRFQVAVLREDGRTILTLTPRGGWTAKALAAVAIVQRDGEAVPSEFTVTGRRGDRTETVLKRLAVNPPLSDEAFTLTLGPDVRVIEVGAPRHAGGSDR